VDDPAAAPAEAQAAVDEAVNVAEDRAGLTAKVVGLLAVAEADKVADAATAEAEAKAARVVAKVAKAGGGVGAPVEAAGVEA